MPSQSPLIQLEAGGRAPVLLYNIPEPTRYSGRQVITLPLLDRAFKRSSGSARARGPVATSGGGALRDRILAAMRAGFRDAELFPELEALPDSVQLRLEDKPAGTRVIASHPITERLSSLNVDEVAGEIAAGRDLTIHRNMFGALVHTWIPRRPTALRQPRLVIVEVYRLSSYPGAYGAGRVLNTFSLLPGERTKINITTYEKNEVTSKRASSILDSFTQESSDEFELQVQTEQSDRQTEGDKQGFDVGVEADLTWAEIPVKGRFGFRDETESAREELSRTLSSATEKHASRASAKREVRVDTSFEVRTQTGTETSVERTIENINVSRTLNFVFRQMNQEFFSILHLVDIRIAFQTGRTRRIVPLHDVDSLLEDVVVPAQQARVKGMIVDAVDSIKDFQGTVPGLVVKTNDTRAISGVRVQVNRDLVSTHSDASTGTSVIVPGVILSVNSLVMRTDGVIVDSLLGEGEGLDTYSRGLQVEAVREKSLGNDWKAAKLKREELAQSIVASRDEVSARLFEQVYEEPANCCCCGDHGDKGITYREGSDPDHKRVLS